MVFMEKTTSEMNFDDIADILPGKENVCINVRVLRLWKVHAFLNPSESSSIEMVLVDQKHLCVHFEQTKDHSLLSPTGTVARWFNLNLSLSKIMQ
ncbi:replication protein A 70 kDa DNA-binding subunit [Trifolium repens]|nr:replication protein A 70 kDa DNA-binding subunit [Trifolium repens]